MFQNRTGLERRGLRFQQDYLSFIDTSAVLLCWDMIAICAWQCCLFPTQDKSAEAVPSPCSPFMACERLEDEVKTCICTLTSKSCVMSRGERTSWICMQESLIMLHRNALGRHPPYHGHWGIDELPYTCRCLDFLPLVCQQSSWCSLEFGGCRSPFCDSR